MKALRRCTLVSLIAALPFATACHKDDASGKNNEVVDRLCRHILLNRQKVIVDTNQAELVWSDGAILEIAEHFPPGLHEIISQPSHYHDIRSFLKQFEGARATNWKQASVERSARGKRYAIVKSRDEAVSALVESLYLDYLKARYPKAQIRIREKFEPIIFVVGNEIRASVMPLKE